MLKRASIVVTRICALKILMNFDICRIIYLFLLLSMAMIHCIGAQSGIVIPVKSNTITYLYGTKASWVEGDITKQPGDYRRWVGPSGLKWLSRKLPFGS